MTQEIIKNSWYPTGNAISNPEFSKSTGSTLTPLIRFLRQGGHTSSASIEPKQSRVLASLKARKSVSPTAIFQAPTQVTQVPNPFQFSVVFKGTSKLKKASFNDQDILVNRPDSFSQFAQFVSIKLQKRGTQAIATYQLNAPDGSWDSANNGTFQFVLRKRQVSDTRGNFARQTNLGQVQFDLPPGSGTPNPAPPIGVDPINPNPPIPNPNPPIPEPPLPDPGPNQLPTASATAPSVVAGSSSYTFTVNYTDDRGINVSSLGSNDIRVTGPNSFSPLATLINISASTNGTPRQATYQIDAPGGTWNAADNGTYSIIMRTDQVSDTNGSFVQSGLLQSFTVELNFSGVGGRSNLLIESTFDDGSLGTWKQETSAPHSLQLVSSLTDPTNQVAKFELRKDDPEVGLGRRSEVRASSDPIGSERWYAFRVMLEPGYQNDPTSSEIVAQWHDVPDRNLGENYRNPPLSLVVRNGNWRVRSRWDSKPLTVDNTPEGSAIVWEGAYQSGVWTDWVFHVKWSSGTDGLVEVWKDGAKVGTQQGPSTYNDQIGPYFKYGMYKSDWNSSVNPTPSIITTPRISYFDEVRVGDAGATYEDVAPTGE